MINVSLMPSFYCSQRCGYCYLGHLNKDKTLLDINAIDTIVNNIKKYGELGHIDIYGGELGELDSKYLTDLLEKVYSYTPNFCVVTNLKNDNVLRVVYDINKKYNIRTNIGVSVNEERGFKPIFPKVNSQYLNLSVLQVVLPSLLRLRPKTILNFLKRNYNKDVLFLQYYPSEIARVKYNITNKQYCDFMIGILDYYIQHKDLYDFNIVNLDILSDWYKNKYSPRMESHLFINPEGKYGCVKYKNGLEYFEFYSTIEQWLQQCKDENKKYLDKCNTCPYFGTCIAEHLNPWKESDTCCGHIALMKWYEELHEKSKTNLYKNYGTM